MTNNSRLDILERDNRRNKTARAEVAAGITRILRAALPLDRIAGRLFFVRDFATGSIFIDNGTDIDPANRLPRVAFADLPSSEGDGTQLFVTDGRKPGEGAGAGTGCPVVYTNGAWYSTFDGAVVAS